VLGAVTHFLANEADRTRALKRGGGIRPLPFEITVGEEYLPHEPRDESTPDRVFEQRWAFSVLDAALARLRAECVAARRDRLFDRLQFCLSAPVSMSPSLRTEWAVSSGCLSTVRRPGS
jgi:hypothetical protein